MDIVNRRDCAINQFWSEREGAATPDCRLRPFGLTIVVESVEGGVIKGVATLHDGKCRGDHPVEGKMDGNMVKLRATEKGGPAGDCGFKANLTVEGNKLAGTMGDGDPVQLSK